MEEESGPNEASQQTLIDNIGPMEEQPGPHYARQQAFFGNTGPMEAGDGSCPKVAHQPLLVNAQHASHSYEHRDLNQRREIDAADSQNRHLFNVRLEDYINSPPSLGLRLQKTKALMKSIEESLNDKEGANESPSRPKKFPAAHFAASFLAIGEFKIVATNESNLVARCYYGKRKLVWEILDRGIMLKQKIEVPWENILAMRAITEINMPGILEIELENGPRFYREIDPGPRCHSAWELSEDFTGGHALRYRRHYLKFPTGVLNKYYERMLQCDNRLLELSQRPFPSLDSPFFYSDLLYEAAMDYSQRYDLYGLFNNPASHHQPALVFSTQQAKQFGNTMPSSLTYSTPPTLGLDSYANMALSQGLVGYANMAPGSQELYGYTNIALKGQGIDGYANILQSYSMPGVAREIEFHSSRLACDNFSNFVNELVEDFDIHMGMTNSSGTFAGPILMETYPASNSTYTSTQNNYFPNTMVDSMDALAPWSEEHYSAGNANMNDMYGALSDEDGSQLNTEELQYTAPLQAANQNLENHLSQGVHPNYFVSK